MDRRLTAICLHFFPAYPLETSKSLLAGSFGLNLRDRRTDLGLRQGNQACHEREQWNQFALTGAQALSDV
jgi:hypothetical protein